LKVGMPFQVFTCFLMAIKQPRAATSQRLLAENVRDTASKIKKVEHKIVTYKMA